MIMGGGKQTQVTCTCKGPQGALNREEKQIAWL